MSKQRVKNTYHSIERAKERTNLSKKEIERLMSEASRLGLSWGEVEDPKLREFLKSKSLFKRVKYYKGYIFVFQKNSTSCITMYAYEG